MKCPHCHSTHTREYQKRSWLGYRIFRCHGCQTMYNERTGTAFNELHFPTNIVLLVVLWRLRYKLSLRDLVEMFSVRGYAFSHETVRDWEARFAPLLTVQLRAKRRGQSGKSWYVDETYVKVKGAWCYLYRAIDRDGNLVDTMLSKTTPRGSVVSGSLSSAEGRVHLIYYWRWKLVIHRCFYAQFETNAHSP